MSLCIALFFTKYKVHVFSILIWNQILRYKSTRLFSSLSTENKFNGRKGQNQKFRRLLIRPKYPCQKVFLENRKIHVLFVGKSNFLLLKIWNHLRKPGPWCLFVPQMYFIVPGSKSQVQSTKYSTSTGTSTCIYFGDVWGFQRHIFRNG